MENKDRPILIGIIGAVTIIVAIITLTVAALSLFDSNILKDIAGTIDISDWVGYGGFLAGIILLIIGLAIWRGWTIAWFIAVIIYLINALASIYMMAVLFFDNNAANSGVAYFIISFVISIIILYYLFRPKVKEFFNV